MPIIRSYAERIDSGPVGVLIAETYRKYNLGFASPAEQAKLLGPFRHAGSSTWRLPNMPFHFMQLWDTRNPPVFATGGASKAQG